MRPPDFPAESPKPTAAAIDLPQSPPTRSLEVKSAGFESVSNTAATGSRTGHPADSSFGGASVLAAPAASRRVSQAQFDSVVLAAAAPRASAHAASFEPIEILAKPKPLYTDEARRLRIEGEVVLEVLFRASAQVAVLRVLRGLGHGLDANAEQAALGIRFQPAAEGGRPVDSIATVKIEFQLAD